MSTSYWRGAAEDEAMQDEHGFIWKAMLDTIDIDLRDSGCSTPAATVGVSCGCLSMPRGSPRATDTTQLLAPSMMPPPRRQQAAYLRDCRHGARGMERLDVAFSHEVLYLLEDLTAHAISLFGAMRPGGAYFAVMGVHEDSPMMSAWHAENSVELGLPRLYGLDEVTGAFEAAGFSASVANLKLGFVPVSAHRHGNDRRRDLLAWLDYYSREKVLLRFTRQTS